MITKIVVGIVIGLFIFGCVLFVVLAKMHGEEDGENNEGVHNSHNAHNSHNHPQNKFAMFLGVVATIIVAILLINAGVKWIHYEFTKLQPMEINKPIISPDLHQGEGWSRKEVGLRVYLNPLVSHTRPSGPAKYVWEENPDIYYADPATGLDPHQEEKWWAMPAGFYLVYPTKQDKIYFRWW